LGLAQTAAMLPPCVMRKGNYFTTLHVDNKPQGQSLCAAFPF
jgi:hypothetical protein